MLQWGDSLPFLKRLDPTLILLYIPVLRHAAIYLFVSSSKEVSSAALKDRFTASARGAILAVPGPNCLNGSLCHGFLCLSLPVGVRGQRGIG